MSCWFLLLLLMLDVLKEGKHSAKVLAAMLGALGT